MGGNVSWGHAIRISFAKSLEDMYNIIFFIHNPVLFEEACSWYIIFHESADGEEE